MTTVFLPLSDGRVVLFILANNLLHFAAVCHKHMTCHIIHAHSLTCGLTDSFYAFTAVDSGCTFANICADLQLSQSTSSTMRFGVFFLQTFCGDTINHQMAPFRKMTPNIKW